MARFITKPAISPDIEAGWDPRPYLWYGQQPGLQSFHVAAAPFYIINQALSVDAVVREQRNPTGEVRTVRTSD